MHSLYEISLYREDDNIALLKELHVRYIRISPRRVWATLNPWQTQLLRAQQIHFWKVIA